MKTKTTIKQTLLALTIALSIVSCKKDKKDEPTPTPAQAISFTDLKALSTGASVKVPDAKKITGIVISDVSSKNIDSKTVVLQDAASQAGIIVTFDAAQTFALGDQVEVDISGQTLAQVNGEIELTNVPAVKAKKTGTGTITAKTTTAADIATNKAAWDGTLVTIAATDLSGTTSKYSGTLTIKDASGTVTSAVLAGASFETTDLPASVSSVTGIVRVSGTDVRVDIRKTIDIAVGSISRVITEDFTNVAYLSQDGFVPSLISTGSGGEFTTALGSYGSGTGELFYLPGSTYDQDFTASGKSYIYMITGGTGTIYSSYTNSPNLNGLKQISITFAGSKLNGVLPILPSGQGPTVSPFDPNTDFIQIGFATKDSNGAQGDIVMSPKYTKTGEFYTFTWTVPAGTTNFYLTNLSTRANESAPILIDKIVFGF